MRELTLDIYDTVVDQSKLPGTLQRFADAIGARGCIVFEMSDSEAGRRLAATTHSQGYEPSLIDAYITQFERQEIIDQTPFEACSLASDRIELIDESIIGKTKAELRAQPNVRWMRALGINHRVGGLLDKDNRYLSRFSVQFSSDVNPLDEEMRAGLNGFLPHIAKALDLGRPAAALATMNRGLVAALDQLRFGVCLLDGKGSVVVTNQEFDRQIDEHRAFRIDPSGRLAMLKGVEQRRFLALLSDVLNHGRHGARPRKEAITLNALNGEDVLCVEVVPLEYVAEVGSAQFGGAIVYSHDTSLPMTCDTTAIKAAFGFTEAEGSLIEAICDGLSNKEIAEQRDRSMLTVKSQVKSILAKSGCSNRTQLVRTMMQFGGNFLRSV